MQEHSGRHRRDDGVELAWRMLPGAGPAIVFLPGFKSDMSGAKAAAVAEFCAARGQAMLRLDYSGHGASGGEFVRGTIGEWVDDARAVVAAVVPEGDLILVGSSMGGWIALLLALALPGRVAGLVGIAAAPDFTEKLMWEAMAPPERAALQRHGVIEVPSQYGAPTPITLRLIEEGRRHLLLDAPIALRMKVRLLHGQRDPDVPWEMALKLAARLASDDVRIHLIKDGDHRLSRPSDLALLTTTLADLLHEDGF